MDDRLYVDERWQIVGYKMHEGYQRDRALHAIAKDLDANTLNFWTKNLSLPLKLASEVKNDGLRLEIYTHFIRTICSDKWHYFPERIENGRLIGSYADQSRKFPIYKKIQGDLLWYYAIAACEKCGERDRAIAAEKYVDFLCAGDNEDNQKKMINFLLDKNIPKDMRIKLAENNIQDETFRNELIEDINNDLVGMHYKHTKSARKVSESQDA